jgi:hypothetical protein
MEPFIDLHFPDEKMATLLCMELYTLKIAINRNVYVVFIVVSMLSPSQVGQGTNGHFKQTGSFTHLHYYILYIILCYIIMYKHCILLSNVFYTVTYYVYCKNFKFTYFHK